MSTTHGRFGPIATEVSISTTNMWSLMYAALVSIGVVTGMAAMTPYVLTVNLGIPENAQGSALGTLALWQELALILCYGPLGILADKFGRKIILCRRIFDPRLGLCIISLRD
jgi:MFS family permease